MLHLVLKKYPDLLEGKSGFGSKMLFFVGFVGRGNRFFRAAFIVLRIRGLVRCFVFVLIFVVIEHNAVRCDVGVKSLGEELFDNACHENDADGNERDAYPLRCGEGAEDSANLVTAQILVAETEDSVKNGVKTDNLTLLTGLARIEEQSGKKNKDCLCRKRYRE